ncbi:MAG: hypothetical protein OXU69_11195 [Gemmatimonadota bacterium]|nr:hypothetical protein [Gemmatimonadota bacterium]
MVESVRSQEDGPGWGGSPAGAGAAGPRAARVGRCYGRWCFRAAVGWGGEEGGVCHEDDGRRRRIGIVMQLRLRDAVRLDSGNGAVAWRRLAARVAGEG